MIKKEATVTFQFIKVKLISKIINTTSLKIVNNFKIFNCRFVSIDISFIILSKFVCVNFTKSRFIYFLNNKNLRKHKFFENIDFK